MDTSETISGGSLFPYSITLNEAFFAIEANNATFSVSVIQQQSQTILFCECAENTNQMCLHQARALSALTRQEDLQLFFDNQLRHARLKRVAYDYGLENEPDLDEHFRLELYQNRLVINPVNPALTAVTHEHLAELRNSILSPEPPTAPVANSEAETEFIVLRQHKYYKGLQAELCAAPHTQQGKIKAPIRSIDTQAAIWHTSSPGDIKFLMGVGQLKNRTEERLGTRDITALRAVIQNPANYPFYYHQASASESLSPKSLLPIKVRRLQEDITLTVSESKGVYEIYASVSINGVTHQVADLSLRLQCFLVIAEVWYFIDKLPVLSIVQLLKQKSGRMLIYASAFREFKAQFLDKVADKIHIEYTFIAKASPRQLAASEYVSDTEKIIYLSDFGSHVMIMPVMRYNDVEIPVRTKRQVFGKDENGGEFLVDRDTQSEIELTALLIRQHPDFREQLENELDHFYLHKRQFLNEDWFLPAFEDWGHAGIRVLGFNELEGNKVNPHKARIDIKVLSGLNWFNATISARFGRKKASVKKIQVAVKNKSKYVQLDDGTMGILPQEWIEKFAAYFTAGDLNEEDMISIPKINFSDIEELFDEEMLDETTKRDIRLLKQKVEDFTSIQPVPVPKTLQGTLRTYQQEGLNWLNFLDEYNFGGCLADDMGLGKSIQIIAFALLQKEKTPNSTNLLVVPTTLIFNWQAEISRFAPSLSVYTLQGADRIKGTDGLEKFDIILISYNTLLTDINYLRYFEFNYIFLDESQQIKNPESQRYKAARLLQSRNKVVITGTPIENNTFDLYSQFSFACPGLFGNKRHFKELYSVPIDRFKDSRRAKELQQKIKPFLLRRTKQQVAKELPKKTEMILYCPMETEQRETYNAYEKEFRDYISVTEAEELERNPMHALKGLTKLRQICNSTKLLKSDEILGKKTSSKIDTLMEQIENNAPHHKMLVFSQFVSMLELIREELDARGIRYALLTGNTRNREAVVESFQQNEDIRVFLISLKAGGTGLNLVEASYVYLVDPWWNPAVENQAIDRVHRIGQENNVTAIRLICPDTIEQKILQLQTTKKQLSGELITEDSASAKLLSKAELLKML
ncbi:DEAD/DEAH box helicase [Marinoscillum sp. 108]|uniref:DEAD/DEAH box helicase n=1 Tax=Marinoscillum sp. 108 TaxID=2653151 RepID=UPI0012F01DE8|nr:DEAD/DEAH box helicase [Marinoscillum sp. 108]VXD12389.1 DNA helicase [Marinoscillum sp. 108]